MQCFLNLFAIVRLPTPVYSVQTGQAEFITVSLKDTLIHISRKPAHTTPAMHQNRSLDNARLPNHQPNRRIPIFCRSLFFFAQFAPSRPPLIQQNIKRNLFQPFFKQSLRRSRLFKIDKFIFNTVFSQPCAGLFNGITIGNPI
ncbi:Uncharacterised protein [Neisseria canis]|uniref:Uncharacterized protein n=1 Tax=Neisseria canis TaxID=493 RepID=A0A3S4SHZ1_9NEIS|nr:Uncharacterised protein [Neisseria canis]